MPDSVRSAQVFLETLIAGEFARAVECFDPSVRSGVTDQSLSAIWGQITMLFGKPLKHSGTRTARTIAGTADVVYLSWDLEKERLDARVVVNRANRVIGVSFETPVIK